MPPLHGVRVIELGNYLAGPYGAMQLADLGADVIKIEPPRGGDKMRGAAPFVEGESSAYMLVNRNKRSIGLDVRTEGGLRAARKLIETADILIQNLRPGSAKALGLGYEDLRELNPGLIYVSASGWGESGPLAPLPGLDIMAQAYGGLMSITGPEEGEPCKVGVPVCDLVCGIYVGFAAVAALWQRRETGVGQHVEVNLLESGVSLAVWEAARNFVTGEIPKPQGSAHAVSAPYQSFRAADASFVFGAVTDQTWKALCEIIDREDLYLDKDKYGDKNKRRANRAELVREIEAATVQRTASEWVEALRAVGIPCSVIQTYDQVFNDDHLNARDFFWEAPHPVAGAVRQIGSPMGFSETPTRRASAGPLLGQHSREVLAEAGLTDAEIEQLIESEAVAVSTSNGR